MRNMIKALLALLLAGPLHAGAFQELLAAAPAAVAPVAVPVSVKSAAVAPSITPAISDPVRTGMILKLLDDIDAGNPLAFPGKDGSVWTNREGTLPRNADPSWYREYTLLPPPGSTSSIDVGDRHFEIAPARGTRGVERLIIGGGRRYYYTPDHYATFIELTITR